MVRSIQKLVEEGTPIKEATQESGKRIRSQDGEICIARTILCRGGCYYYTD
jgi:hypothetical protein